MDKESRQAHANIERKLIEDKFGPMEEAVPIPQEVMDAYEKAEAAIKKYREVAIKATEDQPDYCKSEVENMTNMASSYLEESLGYIRD